MKIKFCGAAQTVTGSQHLLEINGKKILLDCGLYQGKRSEAYDINKNFLFNPQELHCVVLSHAHIDHAGSLPTLFNNGFTGDIYSTPATKDLCSIMLLDSAHIQEKDIMYVNKRKARKHEPFFKPLYTVDDAKNVLKNFKCSAYRKPFFIDGMAESIEVEFFDAGHILGSAQVVLTIKENGKTIRFGFTGDLGRPNLPILKDPEFMGHVDYLISESTYGGRVHDKSEMMEKQLGEVINKAMQDCGKILVPAFSVGRTQEVLYALSKLNKAGAIPHMPVYIDSPLSANASEIFKLHPECFDEETSRLLADGVDIFSNANIRYVRDVEDSKKLNFIKECCMIISASGMCEGGRILHHLKNHISDPTTTVLIIGFMAANTLGRRIIESKGVKGAVVKIFGEPYSVNADIQILNSFSAHADKNELHDYMKLFDRNRLKKIFLVHGELDQQNIFRESLLAMGFDSVEVPAKGEEFEID